jgi:hypothetical protein
MNRLAAGLGIGGWNWMTDAWLITWREMFPKIPFFLVVADLTSLGGVSIPAVAEPFIG